MVLVPGFEPGSTDREPVMMDRTTLHERVGLATEQLYLKGWISAYSLLSLSLWGLLLFLIC